MPSQKKVFDGLVRVDKDLKKVLKEIKDSENLKSLREASKHLAKQFNRKKLGQLSDYLIPIILSITIGLSLLVVGVLYTATGDGLAESSIIKTNEINNTISFMQNIPTNLDFIFLLLFVGMHIVLYILSYLIPTTPILTPFFFLGAIGLWLTTPIISNFYESISTSAAMSSIVASMPIMNAILLQLPYLELISLSIVMILFFGKGLGAPR